VGSIEQTKTGNLIIEGVLRLGQFTTANAPAGAEGALYYDTTENTTKVYSSAAWGDLGGGGEPGQLPTYTTAERDALSPTAGLQIYNTTENTVQIYGQTAWKTVAAKLALAATCSLDGDCDSTHCVDGYCCDTGCTGNCQRCNVADSIGTCINVDSDCTGNCVVCSGGVCTANDSICTGNCDVCSGSGTAYNCAASNALCSNSAASCYCSGNGTAFNCQSCPDDPYGVCGHPTCSSYTCDTAYDNGAGCDTCHTCLVGACTEYAQVGTKGSNCTATHYACDGTGNCVNPCSSSTAACFYGGYSWSCNSPYGGCATHGYCGSHCAGGSIAGCEQCDWEGYYAGYCKCYLWLYD